MRFRIVTLSLLLGSQGMSLDLPRMNPAAMYTTTLPDSYVLSELPVSELLKVKKSLNNIICSGLVKDEIPETCPTFNNQHTRNPINSTSDDNAPNNSTEPASSRTFFDFIPGSPPDEGPVSGELQDHRKTYYDHGGSSGGGLWKGSEESGKIQKLFQFSVTALAFLAFGGYLLCMIVQAIKSKGTNWFGSPPLLFNLSVP